MRATVLPLCLLVLVGCVAKRELEDPSFVDGDEPADAYSRGLDYRGTLTYGQSVEAEYSTTGYAGYSFSGVAGDEITIELAGIDNDPVLYLYGPKSGTTWSRVRRLAYNDDTNGLDSYLAHTLPHDGEYLIVVREYSGTPGRFGLTLERQCARDGECTADPCAGVVCTAPPEPTCIDAQTQRTFAGTGTCGGGSCSYSFTDTVCSGGCRAGSCVSPACNSDGTSCSADSYCCSGHCLQGSCSSSACLSNGWACTSSSECCTGTCSFGHCADACRSDGAYCRSDADCCSEVCGVLGRCARQCRAVGSTCANSSDCCSLSCSGGYCVSTCRAYGAYCWSDSDCCDHYCNNGYCR